MARLNVEYDLLTWEGDILRLHFWATAFDQLKERGAVFLRSPDGRVTADVSRGLSTRYMQAVNDFPTRSLPSLAVAARRPLYATNYRNDLRGSDVRAAVVQEGFDTLCTAP